jgi:anti-anti-sigma factor
MGNQKTQEEENLVRLAEDIVASRTKEIRDEIVEAVDRDNGNLVLDFSKVVNIDSIGLGIIIAACNTLKKEQRILTLINVSDDLCSFFSALRLDQVFEIRSK